MRSRRNAAAAAVLAIAVGIGCSMWPRAEIPAHMRADAVLLTELIGEADLAALRSLVKRFGAEGYALNTNE